MVGFKAEAVITNSGGEAYAATCHRAEEASKEMLERGSGEVALTMARNAHEALRPTQHQFGILGHFDRPIEWRCVPSDAEERESSEGDHSVHLFVALSPIARRARQQPKILGPPSGRLGTALALRLSGAE